MAMDHGQQGRRGGHFHNRGRRGADRRGRDRQQPAAAADPTPRGDRVDVEQIMREIRARVSQRSGVDLSNQQIQELAARRLEAILDPRAVKPALLDQLRRAAGERPPSPEPAVAMPPLFEEVMLYDSPNGLLRFVRRLLNPILRLLFNPTPIAHALAVHGRLQAEAAARAVEQERRQAEWNALHYDILQRLVTEVARGSLEAQSLALRVESLGAKVDFNDRRVRAMDGSQPRPPRSTERAAISAPPVTPVSTPPEPSAAVPSESKPGQADAPRRRRRRRRGRRGTGMVGAAPESAPGSTPETGEPDVDNGADQAFEDEPAFDEPAARDDALSTAPPAAPDVSASPSVSRPGDDPPAGTPEE